MNKQEILKVLNDERNAHELWAKQGKVIADAINLDNIIEPVNYADSDLYLWLKSNKSSISAFSWYKELEQAHVKLHYSYSDLFENATRKYNPKTRDELLVEFKTVEIDIDQFNKKIKEIEKNITDMSDIEYLDFVLKSNGTTRKTEVERNKTVSTVKVETIADTNDSETLLYNKEAFQKLSSSEDIKSKNIEATIELQDKTQTDVKINTESQAELESDISVDADKHEPTGKQMQGIDIDKFEANEVEAKTEQVLTKDAVTNKNTSLSQVEKVADKAQLISEYKSITNSINSVDNLKKHITLKEQNIKRLKLEKELTQQELTHLEETQKLSQQGVEQAEQHLALKQEEIELEQLDSEKLLQTNTDAKTKANDQLTEIENKKDTLKNEIIDLEQENIKDELIQEDYKKIPSIERQFDVLKKSKNKEVDKLEKLLSNKKADLIELKQQVLILDEEITNIEDEMESKQQGISELEAKEQAKNDERSSKLEATKSIIKQRNTTINTNNQKLDTLSLEENTVQTELDDLNTNFEKIQKTITSMADVNNAEIEEIEQQQVTKQKQLTEIYNQKLSKQKEIDKIHSRLEDAETSLNELETEMDKNTDKVLEVID